MIIRKSMYSQMKVLTSTVNFCDREVFISAFAVIEGARLAPGRLALCVQFAAD
jgi:hypothetical protein